MKKELENELYQICPTFFQEAIACQNGEMNEMDTCMAFGCECEDGWFEPLKKFANKVKLINEMAAQQNFQFVCNQLKEKYAELRIYYETLNVDNVFEVDLSKVKIIQELFSDALKTVEAECWNTCEWCGQKNDYTDSEIVMTRGWYSRICRSCAKEYEDNQVKKFDENNNREYKPRIVRFDTCYDFLDKLDDNYFKYKECSFNTIWAAYYYNLFKDLSDEKLKQFAECFNLGLENSTKHCYDLGIKLTAINQIDNNINLMKDVLFNKYSKDGLKNKLKSTDGYDIVYFNRNCDNYWGVCLCDKCKDKEHHNHLGNLIQEVRNELK